MGGGEKYMLTVAQCLSKNHFVYLFWDHGYDFQKAQNRFDLNLSGVKQAKNIFSPNLNCLDRFLEAKKYDRIIYLSDGSIPFVFGKKMIVHFQFPVEWVNGYSFKTKLKISQIKKIICNSQFTKFYIDRKFGVISDVLYPPVNVEYQNQEEKKENIILNVGRFGNRGKGSSFKKQELMVEVFEKMFVRGIKNWRLILVVSTREEGEEELKVLKDHAKKFPIEFLWNLKNRDLQKVYGKSKIYWHAAGFGEDLNKHPERAEHFGISTAEAMGFGCVPVVINAGGQPEIVHEEENGFLWENIDELIEKTKRLVHDEKLWEKMSKKAQKRGQFFAGDRFCKEVEQLIK